jgi:hypothetical protein
MELGRLECFVRAETINRNSLHFPQSDVVWFHWFLWSRLDPPWFLRLDALRQEIHGLPQLPSLLQRLLARPCQGSICIGRISYRVLEEKQNFANHKGCPRGTSWRCLPNQGIETPASPAFLARCVRDDRQLGGLIFVDLVPPSYSLPNHSSYVVSLDASVGPS